MARRARGEGTIYRYGKGWRLRLRRDGRERTWFLPTQAAAYAKRRELQAFGRDATLLPAGAARLTVADWAEQWLDAVEVAHPKSASIYRRRLAHVLAQLGPMRLEGLRLVEINRALAGVMATGKVGRTSVHLIHTALATMLKAAVIDNVLIRSPMQHAPIPKRGLYEAKPLRQAQFRRLVDEAGKDDVIGAFVLLALATGARRSELLALRWSDIDEQSQELTIRRSHRRDDKTHQVVADTPKSKNSTRVLHIDPRTLEALHRHQHRQAELRLAAGNWPVSDLIFVSPQGRPMTHDTSWIDRRWHNLRSRAGLPTLRLHDLRHTAASMLLPTVGVMATSRILGHSDAATTLRQYGHTHADEMARGLQGIADEMFSPKTSPTPVTKVLQSAVE